MMTKQYRLLIAALVVVFTLTASGTACAFRRPSAPSAQESKCAVAKRYVSQGLDDACDAIESQARSECNALALQAMETGLDLTDDGTVNLGPCLSMGSPNDFKQCRTAVWRGFRECLAFEKSRDSEAAQCNREKAKQRRAYVKQCAEQFE